MTRTSLLSAFDRAQSYMAKIPGAVAGAGGHDRTFAAACALVRFGLNQSEAWTLLLEFNVRCLPRWSESELRHKLEGAFATVRPDSRFTDSASARVPFTPVPRPPVPISAIRFDAGRLASVAVKGPQPASWRHWLWERSPKRPETQNALSFLKHLFKPGEIVLAFDDFGAKHPAWTIPISDPMDCRVPVAMQEGGRGQGVWFLSNPVDGQWHPNPRQGDSRSCRSEESVTSFRFAVLESDSAPAHQWLAFLAQLPIRIAAIYTSGSRSVHVLMRVDAESKAEWDSIIVPLKRPLKVLGVDPGALSAVRLTRLPGCWRPEKGGFQRLLYLNPDPPDLRLADIPVQFSRAESLARWKKVCPRWNRGAEAGL